ncbi:MAG: oxidoreductase [Sphingomonadales bacterium 12-68-11]|nr:MAG: oxidoreductase [Sphingomonadales bacterium 12-68-11]
MSKLGGTWQLGDRTVHRMGYGAMQLAGPGVFGPPKNRDSALAVLREAVALGIDHIDTSDYYGPHVVNDLIREALAPYPEDLVLVTKLGAKRDDRGGWRAWDSPEALEQGLRDNLERLGLETIYAANMRIMGSQGPSEGSIARFVEPLVRLKEQGLLRHIGLSNVTQWQVEEARELTEVICVQNHYNLVHRADDMLIDWLAREGIAFVPFFPLGGFTPLQSDRLSAVARRLEATPMQVALAWLLQRSPNILLIPGTSSVAHLRENVAAAELDLDADALVELDILAG